MRCFLIIGLFCASIVVFGQQGDDFRSYLPTENVDKKAKFNKKKNQPERQDIRLIIKNYKGKILYGNPCWIEETHKMGFEYVVQTPGIAGSVKPFRRIWENTKTITILILTKSPFWKLVLNSRIKDCRKKTGDLVG